MRKSASSRQAPDGVARDVLRREVQRHADLRPGLFHADCLDQGLLRSGIGDAEKLLEVGQQGLLVVLDDGNPHQPDHRPGSEVLGGVRLCA